MKQRHSKKLGFTLLEVMIVVAVIGLLAVIAIPNFVKARANSQQNSCINNLHQINEATDQWALEQRKSTGADIHYPNDLTPYMKLNSAGSIPGCPASGTYSVTKVGANPGCSLSNLTATPHMLP